MKIQRSANVIGDIRHCDPTADHGSLLTIHHFLTGVTAYGRACGVGRALGVGFGLPPGVGETVAVAVGVAVGGGVTDAVAVGVAVGVAEGIAVAVGVAVGEPAETLTTPVIPEAQWTQQK